MAAEAAAAQTKVAAEAAAGALTVQAEAQARATRITGEAEGDAIRARGVAEADAVKARMEAEAAGIERRAAALSRNQEAVIAQQIAANLPEIVRAAASSFEHVGTFTVLNGAAGVTETLAEMIQQAGVLANIARQTISPMMNAQNGDGSQSNGEHAAIPPRTFAASGASRRPARSRPDSSSGATTTAAPAGTAPDSPAPDSGSGADQATGHADEP